VSIRRRLFRRHEAQTPGNRRTRITQRCLSVDLRHALPSAGVDIGAIDHPVMRRARELTPSFPASLARVAEIDGTHVFRFTHGRDRVATWLDEHTGTIWVCAVDGRDEETNDHFRDLHARGELLPGGDDVLRERVEAAGRFVAAAREGVPRWLDEAHVRPNHDVTRTLPGGQTVRVLFRPGAVEEFWLAMPTLATPGGLAPRLRGVVVAAAQEHPGEIEWEQRDDWPTGELRGHEIAFVGRR